MDKVKVALCGTGFIGEIHAKSLMTCPDCDVVAVYTRDKKKGEKFADEFRIPEVHTDFDKMLAEVDCDAVTLGLPNDLHRDFCVKAANKGKHVFVEKPLCVTLEEADEMILACQKAGVLLVYGENLCFAPKYARAKRLVDEGALGKVFLIKQRESHFGPHASWFWDVKRSGGGAFMDMGCHGIEFARWALGKPEIESVYLSCGTFVHGGSTQGEDDSIAIITFDGGARAIIENSWAQRGGLDDRIEIFGSEGVAFADLVHGNAIRTYSEVGYGYASEKAPGTTGWSSTIYQEEWLYGYPAELGNFVHSCKGVEKPVETGEDGRIVLEALFAGYESARTGKAVSLPFKPPRGKKPIELWKELK